MRLEILASLAEMMAMASSSEVMLPAPESQPAGSVKDLLNMLAVKRQRFGQWVFNVEEQALTGRVAVFINGCALELLSGLETKLRDGDTVSLVPPIEGG